MLSPYQRQGKRTAGELDALEAHKASYMPREFGATPHSDNAEIIHFLSASKTNGVLTGP